MKRWSSQSANRRRVGPCRPRYRFSWEQLEDRSAPAVYSSTDVPQAIPDLGTITSTLTISDSYSIGDLDVILNITHTLDFDLSVVLVAPDGTRIELFTGAGSVDDDFIGTILDAEATATNITAPLARRFQPAGPLQSLYGTNINGIWGLEISDQFKLDEGTLHGWSLAATPASAGPRPDLAGISLDVDQATDRWGDTITVNYTIGNQGAGAAGPFQAQLFISANSSIGLGDVAVGAPITIAGLAAGAQTAGTVSVTLPASPPTGFDNLDSVFLGLVIDDDYSILETSKENNSNQGNGIDRRRLDTAGADTLATAIQLARAPNVTIKRSGGISTLSDVDIYALELLPGDTLVADIDTPASVLDTMLRIFDASGAELAFNDDANGFDSFLSFRIPAAGRYYVGVSGFDNSSYNPKVPQSGLGISTGTFDLKVTVVVAPGEGDTLALAKRLPRMPGVTLSRSGAIGTTADVDLYAIDLAAGDTLEVDIDTPVGALDSMLRIFGGNGAELAFNDDSGGHDSLLSFRAPAAGRYYFGVSGYSNRSYNPSVPNSGSGISLGAFDVKVTVTAAVPDLIGDPGDDVTVDPPSDRPIEAPPFLPPEPEAPAPVTTFVGLANPTGDDSTPSTRFTFVVRTYTSPTQGSSSGFSGFVPRTLPGTPGPPGSAPPTEEITLPPSDKNEPLSLDALLPMADDGSSAEEVARSLLIGSRPVADLLPQQGTAVGAVGTLLTTDSTDTPRQGEDLPVEEFPLKELLIGGPSRPPVPSQPPPMDLSSWQPPPEAGEPVAANISDPTDADDVWCLAAALWLGAGLMRQRRADAGHDGW